MNFLVIGHTQSAQDLADALRGSNKVTHVLDAEQLRESYAGPIGERPLFEWILVDESDPCGAEMATRIVRENFAEVPVSRVSAPQASVDAPRRSLPMCAVETTGEGMQILRCALRHAAHSAEGDPALRAAIGERPLVFEYHAPHRKTG